MNLFEKLNRLDDSLSEGAAYSYLVYAASGLTDEEGLFDDLRLAKKLAKKIAIELSEKDPGAYVLIKRGIRGSDVVNDTWKVVNRVKYDPEKDSFEFNTPQTPHPLYGMIDENLNEINNSLVESYNLSANILSDIRDQFKNAGHLRIGNKGVRFISIEDDFAQYISRDAFNKYIYSCIENDMPIEDIADDIPWEETIYVHHAFEIPEYNSDKRRLNREYGFTQERTPTIQQNNKERLPKTTFTDLKKQGAPIVPYVKDCMNRLNSIAYKKSVKVLDYNTCVIQVTTLGEGLADVENAVKPVEKTFPGTITTRWGKDASDWRLSRFNVELRMLPEGMNESKRVVKKKKLTESLQKKQLKENYQLSSETWNNIKNYADLETTTGRDFAYDGPYADEVGALYGAAIDQYNEVEETNVQYQASIQNGCGASELFDDFGGHAYRDFEIECDELLDFAREATCLEDFMSSLVSYIYSFAEDLEYDEEDYDDDIDEMLTENRNNPYFTPYGYRDAAKVILGTAPKYYYNLKEIEMDHGDGVKLAKYLKNKGIEVDVDVDSDPDYPTFYVTHNKKGYHWNDYFYPYEGEFAFNIVPWDGKMFAEEQLTEASYDPYPAGKYGDLIFNILDNCSGDAIINFMHEYQWPFYESGDSISDVYDKINKYLDTHSGYGLWSDLDKQFN